ncbi:MAG: 8-oxo-dGTP diphosphatase MutT [Nitrospirales bacterium]|nr:8-oxo-dGTP diphosphatase MutT [Nitrospirales bacterium]
MDDDRTNLPPNSIVVVVAGIIEYQGKLLITKRKAGTHLGGVWEFPGGKKEIGESLVECLKREIWEELHITVGSPSLYATVRHQYPEKLVELHFFRCALVAGIPQLKGCAEIAWVSKGELQNYAFPDADQTIIKQLYREICE